MTDHSTRHGTTTAPAVGDPDVLRHALRRVATEGWDGPAGSEILGYARVRVVRPQVARAGLRGVAAAQAESTGWATAWEVLRAPSTVTAQSPWGVVTAAVRRAVLGELVAAAYGTTVRNGWRMRADLAAMPDGHCPVSLTELVERGWEPAAPASGPARSPGLAAIVAAMVEVGWACEHAWLVVDWATGAAGCRTTGWRSLSMRTGIPAWRARRALALLLGEDGWPGLVERVLESGVGSLAQPDIRAALVTTVRSSHPSPARAATAVTGSLCRRAS